MKFEQGFWFPDEETHFIDYLKGNGEYQGKPKQALDILVDDWKCVIDIGAHVGTWSAWFAKRADEVHSFEPVSINHECLVKNLKQFDRCRTYNLAVCEDIKQIQMWKPPVAKNSGTFSSVPVDGWDMFVMDAINIDSLNLSPTVMKLDIQGGEYPALQGSKDTIARCKPVICCEENHEDTANRDRIARWMSDMGYIRACKIKEDAVWIHNSFPFTTDKRNKLSAIATKR